MPLLRSSLIVLAAALLLVPAVAATLRTGAAAASQPARAWATRDQLRDCLATEAALKERFAVIEASNAAHEKMFDQVEAESTRLQDLQPRLDHASDASVRAFNALVKDHNLHVQQLNQDAADSRPGGQAYEADMVAFNHRCGGLAYHVEDMEAVVRERRKATAQAAAASAP